MGWVNQIYVRCPLLYQAFKNADDCSSETGLPLLPVLISKFWQYTH
jgi:hypothetical protein